jgi:hypothetical protein
MDRGLGQGFAPVRCEHCGDVIGVYEPLMLRAAGEVRETSRAAEPDLPAAGAQHYHLECYAQLKHREAS